MTALSKEDVVVHPYWKSCTNKEEIIIALTANASAGDSGAAMRSDVTDAINRAIQLARADLVAENERLKDTADRWCEKANEAANQFVDFVHGEHSRLATERDELRDQLTATRTELAAAEARETKLRAAIDVVLSDAEECEDHDGWLANLVSCEAIHQLDEAFIQPRDDSALREMIAGVYEECEQACKAEYVDALGSGCPEDFAFNNALDRAADAIRALAEKAKGE